MIKYNLPLIIFLFFCFLFSTNLNAQETKIRGKVVDKTTKEPIPFVNITYLNRTIGTITDFDGNFFIETRNPSDSIVISYIGYVPETLKVNKHSFQNLNIELQPDQIILDEVVVLPGENPAFKILREINKHKKENNPEKIETYSYEVYNKIEIDVNNVDEDFKEQGVFKHFKFVFDYLDTSAITGKNFLPIFITETLSDFYYKKTPKTQKEYIKANQISGVKNESVSQFLGEMYLKVNIYDNFIDAFGKGFVSPIAGFGKMYYKYYLVDSTFIDNQWCYQLSFKPKRKQEPTFIGDFWVHDTTFAIKKLQLRIAGDVNVNFVSDLVVNQEYEYIHDKYWMLSKDKLFIDFNLAENAPGFFGRKTTSYKNFEFDEDVDKSKFDEINNVVVLEGANETTHNEWNKLRHDSLSIKEQQIYSMVDSIKQVPMFKTFVEIVTLFVTGYKETKWFEFGPYYTFYSFNPVEGNRFRIGGRTSNEFSTKIMPEGFVAYGTEDKKIKYGLGFTYMLNTLPRRSFKANYSYDIEQLGQSFNAFMHDNILASVLRRNPNYKLSYVEDLSASYEHEWFTGVSNTLHFNHRRLFPTDSIVLDALQEDGTYNNISRITSTELTLTTRLAYREQIVMGKFERVSLGSKYPIITFHYTKGLKGIWESDYNYHKIVLNYDHLINVYPFGYFKYRIDAGKVFGKVPYPLLMLHEGNETYAFDPYAYNMMNYYEFVSDKWASLYVEHHFEGLFLNRVPFFRKLKWREIASFRTLIGGLDDENKELMKFPLNLTALENQKNGKFKPYMEASVGVENILKIIRMEAMWRLSYLDKPNVSPFGFRMGLQLRF